MNKVILCGRLVKDPEVKNGNTTITRYTLAVDRRFKQDNQPTADFIPCIAFGKTAEFAEKYLKKGTKVIVGGQIRTGSYTNKDGQKVFTVDVLIDEHEFCESKAQAKPTNNNSNGGFMEIPDGVEEDMPFN